MHRSTGCSLLLCFQGGGAFKAERDEKYFIISDGRTLAEFLDVLDLTGPETLDGCLGHRVRG